MAELEVKASAEFDTDGDARRAAEDRRQLLARPVSLPISYNAANPAPGYAFLASEPARNGRLFEVRRVVVSGIDPFTTLAGVSVLAFIGLQVPQDSNVEPNNWGDIVAVQGQIPNTLEFGAQECIMRAGERMIICMKGLPAGQVIIGDVYGWDCDLVCYLEDYYDVNKKYARERKPL